MRHQCSLWSHLDATHITAERYFFEEFELGHVTGCSAATESAAPKLVPDGSMISGIGGGFFNVCQVPRDATRGVLISVVAMSA
jgi:hypothetical protein